MKHELLMSEGRNLLFEAPCAYFEDPYQTSPRGGFLLPQHSLPLGGDGEGLLSEAPCAYSGSASCLFRKCPALIPEAPRAYFRSASRLFWKRKPDKDSIRRIIPGQKGVS